MIVVKTKINFRYVNYSLINLIRKMLVLFSKIKYDGIINVQMTLYEVKYY